MVGAHPGSSASASDRGCSQADVKTKKWILKIGIKIQKKNLQQVYWKGQHKPITRSACGSPVFEKSAFYTCGRFWGAWCVGIYRLLTFWHVANHVKCCLFDTGRVHRRFWRFGFKLRHDKGRTRAFAYKKLELFLSRKLLPYRAFRFRLFWFIRFIDFQWLKVPKNDLQLWPDNCPLKTMTKKVYLVR